VFLSSSSNPLTELQRNSSLHFTEYMRNVHRGQRAAGYREPEQTLFKQALRVEVRSVGLFKVYHAGSKITY